MLLETPLESEVSAKMVRTEVQERRFKDVAGKPTVEKLDTAMLLLVSQLRRCYGKMPDIRRKDGFWTIIFSPEKNGSSVEMQINPDGPIPQYPVTIRRNGEQFCYSACNDTDLKRILPIDDDNFKIRWTIHERDFAQSLPRSISPYLGYPDVIEN